MNTRPETFDGILNRWQASLILLLFRRSVCFLSQPSETAGQQKRMKLYYMTRRSLSFASAEADDKGISVYRKAEKKTQDPQVTVWMLPEATQVEEAYCVQQGVR